MIEWWFALPDYTRGLWTGVACAVLGNMIGSAIYGVIRWGVREVRSRAD